MTRNTVIRLMIADDHDMLRRGLATFIALFDDIKLVGEASNGRDAVDLCRELRPDVVLTDMKMPVMDGGEAIRQMKAIHPDIGIIALSSFSDAALVHDALDAGADGFLLKNISATALAEAIRACHAKLPTFAPEVTKVLVTHKASADTHQLTTREQEVLRLVVAGRSNAEIAHDLAISPHTAKNHVSNILSKFGVQSRGQAVALALRERLVDPVPVDADPTKGTAVTG